jgi:hypothetical protein
LPVAVPVDAAVLMRSPAPAPGPAVRSMLALPANGANASCEPYQTDWSCHVHPSHHLLLRHLWRLPARAARALATATGRCNEPRAHDQELAPLRAPIIHVPHCRGGAAVAVASNNDKVELAVAGLPPGAAAAQLTGEDPPRRSAPAIHINHGDRRGRCHDRASHPSLTLAARPANLGHGGFDSRDRLCRHDLIEPSGSKPISVSKVP